MAKLQKQSIEESEGIPEKKIPKALLKSSSTKTPADFLKVEDGIIIKFSNICLKKFLEEYLINDFTETSDGFHEHSVKFQICRIPTRSFERIFGRIMNEADF